MSLGAKNKMVPSGYQIQKIESHAMKIRCLAGYSEFCKIDPLKEAERFKIQIVSLEEVMALPQREKSVLSEMNAKTWSGGAIPHPLPNGLHLVILNPNQTIERARITVLEEVAHIYYRHKPTLLNDAPRNLYNEKDEKEAYWTGAALLLPSRGVAMEVWKGKSAYEIAATYGSSLELAQMRIKLLGLWYEYKKRENV